MTWRGVDENVELPGSEPTTTLNGADRRWWRWVLPCVIVVPMVALRYGLGEREFVFPEGAALAFGVLVVGTPDWVSSRWRLVVLPTVCAVAGIVVADLPMPKVAAEVLALGFAVAMAQTVGGRLGPVVSAAVLPVVFNITSWLYAATVAGIGLVLAVMVSLPWLRPPPAVAVPPRRWSWPTLVLFSIVAAGWIVVAGLVRQVPTVAVAPPLLVAALEWCDHRARPPSAALRQWTLLLAAAAVGGTASWLSSVMDRGMAPGQVLVATAVQVAAVGVILVILGRTRQYVYPALAIVLVPNLVAPIAPWLYITAIGTGAAVLYGGASVLVGAVRVFDGAFARVVRAGTGRSAGGDAPGSAPADQQDSQRL